MPKLIDLTGKEFGFLRVIRKATKEEKPTKYNKTYWLCECQYINPSTNEKCGNITYVDGVKLKKGIIKSCGCAKGAMIRESKKFYNDYEIINDYIKVYIKNNEFFVIDIEDESVIKESYWYKDCNGYIVTDNYKGKRARLNRVLLNVIDSTIVVDHWDGNKLNNRKYNLRPCSQGNNVLNSKPVNESGVNGVRQNEHGKWTFNIVYKGKYIRIGTFNTKEEAVEARINKEKELFGDYSFFNRPDSNLERGTWLGDMLKGDKRVES